MMYYKQALNERCKRHRSLKTEQENTLISKRKKRPRKKGNVKERFELNQMESLILAQDERWRHA